MPEFSFLPQDSERDDSVTTLLENYFSAVTEHDHTAVMMCTTEDFKWNYDETGFLDYSRDICGTNIKEIRTSEMTQSENAYTLPVEFELEYSDVHTFDNGEEAPAGFYTFNCSFTLIKDDDGYRIKSMSDTPMG